MKRIAILAAAALLTTGCAHMMSMIGAGPDRPPASEFGMGPRRSMSGRYQATIETDQPLVKRRLQTIRLRLADSAGTAIDGAAITVDGGMPQHGHGLPTQPRVTASLGDGRYQVDGVRFNMGGWWELKFLIAGEQADTVVFNLDLGGH